VRVPWGTWTALLVVAALESWRKVKRAINAAIIAGSNLYIALAINGLMIRL